MSGTDGETPVAVPLEQSAGKRAGDAGSERPKAEPPIWPQRMLATLAKGVTGGKWYSLIDKLYPIATLEAAFAAVKANQGAAGVDHVCIEDYAANLETNLARLSASLRTGSYRPQAIRRHYIPKPGSQEKRPLGIPVPGLDSGMQDRVVQTALRMLLEPIPRVRLRRPVGMLLAGLRRPELRLPSRSRLQGRPATGG
jgi:RNA-directed DNA polymerase